MGRRQAATLQAAAAVVLAAWICTAGAQPPAIDNPTKLVTTSPNGGLLLDGFSLMKGNTTTPPSLSVGRTGVNNLVIGPGELAFTPAASGAACISFSFSAVNTSGIDAFLTFQDNMAEIVDEYGDGYDLSMAQPLDRTHYQSVLAGNLTVGVNASTNYMMAMLNRGSQYANVTYSFGALTLNDPGCMGAPSASTSGNLTQESTDNSTLVQFFEEGYMLLPGERFSVALLTGVSCIAFNMAGKPNATVDTSVLVATAENSLGWLAAQLQGSGVVLPVATGPSCHQNPAIVPDGTTSSQVALAGANSTDPNFSVVEGNADISPTEACQVVADNLDPSEDYLLWIYNGLESPYAVSQLRYAARNNGSCADITFRQDGNDILVFTDNLVYEQDVVQNGRNLGAPSPVAIYPPLPAGATTGLGSSSKLSAGAIAGIAIGAVCGLAIILGAAFFYVILPRIANARNDSQRKEKGGQGFVGKDAEEGKGQSGPGGMNGSEPQAYTKEELEKGYVFDVCRPQESAFVSPADYIGANKLSEGTISDISLPTKASTGAATSLDPITSDDENLASQSTSNTHYSSASTTTGAYLATVRPPSGGFHTENYPQSSSSEGRSDRSEEVLMAEMPDHRMMTVSCGREGSVRVSGAPTSSTAGISGGSQLFEEGTGSDSSLELPQLWCDWQMDPADIQLELDKHGNPLKLGAGSFGSVYKARMTKVHDCAVKEFRDSHSKEQQTAILREVAIMISCHHPNIVQFLGACYKDKRMLLVMECMTGGDLYSALKMHHKEGKGPLSWYRRGRQIALDIAKGLHYLHWRKMIHFDLKSSNVLLSKGGQAKLTDMGFSNILTSGKTHLSEGGGGWTMAWASPEVLLGRRCSMSTDIWSLGIVLYEIVMGEVPRRGDMEPIRVPEMCPKEVEQMIYRCISSEPQDRPTALEIVHILEGVQATPRPPAPAEMDQ